MIVSESCTRNCVLVVGYCSVSEKLESAIVLFPRKASEIGRAFILRLIK